MNLATQSAKMAVPSRHKAVRQRRSGHGLRKHKHKRAGSSPRRPLPNVLSVFSARLRRPAEKTAPENNDPYIKSTAISRSYDKTEPTNLLEFFSSRHFPPPTRK
jgi:hypothetical protein